MIIILASSLFIYSFSPSYNGFENAFSNSIPHHFSKSVIYTLARLSQS